MEEGAEIQIKGKGSPSNEIIAENFPNLFNNMDTYIQQAF
jgi:hypothetical protein